MADFAIKVGGVYKNFRLPHEKNTTVKSVFTNALQWNKKNRTIETQHALKDISFEVKKGEFFGIVGRNGSGKSTLLKILAGIYQPNKGSVSVNGRLVPFIELGVGFNGELTGRENVYLNGAMLGFDDKEIDAFYDDIVHFAELEKFMDQKLKNYSSGMQVRLAFSMAIRAEADILLVDEVLAVGDVAFQRKCLEYFRALKKNSKTVVFVSHDMGTVQEFCDRAVLVDKSRIVLMADAKKVADAYTKMFLEEAKLNREINADFPDQELRWGDGAAIYQDVKVKVDPENEANIIISAKIECKEEINKPNIGFLVKNYQGHALFGTNTKLRKVFIDKIAANKKVDIEWAIPNIFNEGKYYFDMALSYNQGVVADLWQDSAVLEVFRENGTPYIVNPDAHFTIRDRK